MFVLLVELETDQARSGELESVLRSLVASAEHEPGILFYAVQRPQDEFERYILCEYYADKAAWETHMQLERVQEKLKCLDSLLKVPPKLTFCDAIATTSLT